VSDDRPEWEEDLAADDLDTGLRNRLRDARAGGADLTRGELLELAEGLTRQRQEMAAALADLSRREQEVADVRAAFERTSRQAAQELDERDARLSKLALELEHERAVLEEREREIPRPPEPHVEVQHPHGARFDKLEAVLSDLRERLDRLETAVSARVRTVPEAIFGNAEDRDDRISRAVELVGEIGRILRAPLEKLPLDGAGPKEDEPATVVTEPTAAIAPAEESTLREPAIDDARREPLPEPEPDHDPGIGHVLFVSTDAGYRLFERTGAPPSAGERIDVPELGGAEATVTGRRPSPLPADRRGCVAAVVGVGP
jgi:hypothetical protein